MATSFDSTLNSLGINTVSSGPTVQPASAATQTLGQADFLKLMTAQMQNQDPFNPTDNTQMIAQIKAVSTTLVWSGIGSLILYKIVDIVIGLRPTPDKEREGLDITDHGERAYNM